MMYKDLNNFVPLYIRDPAHTLRSISSTTFLI